MHLFENKSENQLNFCRDDECSGEKDRDTLATINILPDEILLKIIGYFHPIDLIHCLSWVCRRWNNLANDPSLFTELRVLVTEQSLASGAVRRLFDRAAHHLRKLCIDCAVSLPSAAVEDLFTVCMPNVSHLDISSFNGNSSLPLFVRHKCRIVAQARQMLSECRDAAHGGLEAVLTIFYQFSFYGLITSPFKSTLTELYLGWYINNQDFRYIGELHNLKIFSLLLCLHTRDEEFIHLKKLSNLEELYISCGGEDCDLTPDGIIALFDLPYEMPERSFPYKLRSLALTDLHMCHKEVLEVIVRK
ncbi:unnamed protein product [Gongylonema pulchrum]|uniref:F-box domain-containing protein n=1 Tax=Gongylonema pulchrum TaxID=637853 RepID=A0A183E9B2_9BILA|nr:unnamed protein product [Gongylonema pulchrum]